LDGDGDGVGESFLPIPSVPAADGPFFLLVTSRIKIIMPILKMLSLGFSPYHFRNFCLVLIKYVG
jgi:hypothetical protein